METYADGFSMNSLLVLQYKIYQLYNKIKKEVIDKVDLMHFFNRDNGDSLYYSFYLTTPLIKGSHYVIDYYAGKSDNPKDVAIHLYEHYKYSDYPLSILPFIFNNLLGRELKTRSLEPGFFCFLKGALPTKLNSYSANVFSHSCEMSIPRYYPSDSDYITPSLNGVRYYRPKNYDGDSIKIREDKYFQSKFGNYTPLFESCEGAYDIYAAIIDSTMFMMDFYKPWDIHFEPLGS